MSEFSTNYVLESPTVMEVTLRDGSYLINFEFTVADTELICGRLEEAGFRMIEVGHGIGLGAQRAGMGQAAASDEEYAAAAAGAVNEAGWGMFCIPEFASLDDVDMVADYGIDFIRIGTDVDKVEQSEPFIRRAKDHGIFVTSNFMKSYAIDPETFAQKARQSKEYGSDLLYIVDSAGGMLGAEMEEYFRAVQEESDIPLGFHGHNNLDLAVANSLRALELGASVVDTSLQGMGRSAGNTPTEIFLLAALRQGENFDIDILDTLDIGERYIRPLIEKSGYDSVDVISGYAQFHSSYMGIIQEYSAEYRIDPRRLIVELCRVNKVEAPRGLVERLAREISERTEEVFTARFRMDRYHGQEQQIEDAGNDNVLGAEKASENQ